MSDVAFWLWVAVLAALCLITPVTWACRTYRRWRRDLQRVRLFREAAHTPEGRRLIRDVRACLDAQALAAYDAEMDRYLRGGSSS